MASTAAPAKPASALWELRAPAELGLFVGLTPLLGAAPRGTDRAVVVVPGFGVNDRSTKPLRRLLTKLGHRPIGWAQGRNMGPTREALDGLAAVLGRAVDETGGAVPLIGWSLGGLYARALAQWYPQLVDQVITLGSPLNLGVDDRTTVGPLYDRLERRGTFIRHRGEIDLDAVPCPSTSIFTRTDGIVAWRSCRQTPGPKAENIEVRGSHCALGVNVGAVFAVADRLATRTDEWQAFRPPPVLRRLYPNRSCNS